MVWHRLAGTQTNHLYLSENEKLIHSMHVETGHKLGYESEPTKSSSEILLAVQPSECV